MANKKDASHVVPGGEGFRCLNCGQEQAMAFPISIPVWTAAAKAFDKMHRRCEPSEAGAARFRYATPEEWLRSWDTGTSALTLYGVLSRTPCEGASRPDVPHDPADFGRCHRLLKVAPPSWRADLARVAERHPAWKPLVERWDDLERLYEEELPAGEAPRLFALMRELLGGS